MVFLAASVRHPTQSNPTSYTLTVHNHSPVSTLPSLSLSHTRSTMADHRDNFQRHDEVIQGHICSRAWAYAFCVCNQGLPGVTVHRLPRAPNGRRDQSVCSATHNADICCSLLFSTRLSLSILHLRQQKGCLNHPDSTTTSSGQRREQLAREHHTI